MNSDQDLTPQRRAPQATTWSWIAAGGVASTFAGLGVDAWMHSRDHELAAREGIFTLSNPGHLLLAIGIALVTVGVGGALIASWRERRGSTRRLPIGVAVLGAALAVLTSGAVVQAANMGPAEHHELQLAGTTESAVEHGDEGMEDAPTSADGPSLSMGEDKIEAMHKEGHSREGMLRVDTSFLSDEEETALAAFVDEAEAGAMQYASLDDAAAAGYRIEELTSTEELPGRMLAARKGRIYHVGNRSFSTDGAVVDPNAPETLLYYQPAGGEPVVAGALFHTKRGGPGPESTVIPEELWHTHAKCIDLDQRALVDADEMTGECPGESVSLRHEEPVWMVHVWFLDDLDAAFARRPMDLLAERYGAQG